jgi:hypothetical protein
MSKIILKNVRGSYVYIDEPRKGKDGKIEKYSIQLLINKDHPQLPEINRIIKQVAKDEHGAKIKSTMLKMPLRDGDTDRDSEEYENVFFMNANASKKPGIVNKFNQIPSQNDMNEYCYSGAIFHVSINFFAFDHDGKKGVAAGLNNVMLREFGERLDGTSSATNDFADFAEDGEKDFGNDNKDFDDDDGDDW